MLNKIISLLCVLTIIVGIVPVFAQDTENILISDTNINVDTHNSIIYDLKNINKVTELSIWQLNSNVTGICGYDLYASLDGKNYSKLAYVENMDSINYGINQIPFQLTPAVYARYVKLTLSKAYQKENIDIKKVEIRGYEDDEQINISNGLNYNYFTEQPFVTGDDIMIADTKRNGLTDGVKDIFYTTSNKYTTIIYDLKEPYQIGNINIWSMSDGFNFMDGYEVKYSLNGDKYFSCGFFPNENSRKEKTVVNSPSVGLVGKNARFIKLILHTEDILSLSEVEIFGYKLKDTSEKVPLNVQLKNYIMAYIDWSSYIGEASAYGLYIEKYSYNNTIGMTPVNIYDGVSKEFTYKYCQYEPLEPDTTYYISVTPFDKIGNEMKVVSPIKITTQNVIGGEPKDIFCANYFTDEGGGADVPHIGYKEENVENMLNLMDNLGFNKNRWWWHWESELKRVAKKGMSYSIQNTPDIQTIRKDNSLGTWTYGQWNEADLQGTNTIDYYNEMKKSYNMIKSIDARNVLAAPVLGGTEPTSLQWLEKLYKSDGSNGKETRQYFDYLDFHSYCKIMDTQVEGLPYCTPEMIFKKIDDVKEVMKKYGDEDKPIVSSELGWSTFEGRHYLVSVDRDTQRDYLVRLYLNFISQGIKEAYLYNFQDCGTNVKDFEQNIGIVDWYGVPKPAYYGLYTLVSIMQNSEYAGEIKNLNNPYYGARFWDKTKGQYISAIWSADNQTKSAQIYVPNQKGNLNVIGSDGQYRSLIVENDMANATISGAPIFIYSDDAIEVNSVTTPFSCDTNIDATRGESISIEFLRNKSGEGISGKITGNLPNGWQIISNTDFSSTMDRIPVEILIPTNAEEKEHDIVLDIIFEDNTDLPIHLTVNVIESMQVSIVPKYANQGNLDNWNIAINIKNMINKPMNGKISVVNAQGVDIKSMDAITFADIQQNDIKKIEIPLNSVPKSAGANISMEIEVEGFKKVISRPFNFSAAVNDEITPSIDGIITEGEWDNSMVNTQNSNEKAPYLTDWNGIDDCSFKIYRKWDKDNFYLAAEVKDNMQFQQGIGNDIWQGDGLQFCLDVARNKGRGSSSYHEIGIALNNDNKFVGYRWTAPLLIKQGVLINYKGKITRNDNTTVYEISIPWSDLVDGPAPSEGDIFGFSLLVNDNDGKGRRGWIEYMSGIGSGKDTNAFADMVLIKK